MSTKVRDLMTTGVVLVFTDTPFRHIVELMEEHGISGLPVVDAEGRVLGLVSEGDLVVKEHRAHHVKMHTPFPAMDLGVEQDRRTGGLVAGALMSAPAITIDENAELRAAARLMSMHGIKRVPVTSGGRLVGILSRRDVLRAFLRTDDEIRKEFVDDVLCDKIRADVTGVDVDVHDGVVTLRGSVEAHSTARAIGFHVDRLDGVTRVENELEWELEDLNEAPTVVPPPVGPLEFVL